MIGTPRREEYVGEGGRREGQRYKAMCEETQESEALLRG